MHTSSVSVALVRDLLDTPKLNRSEVREWITRGTGPGGQHKNKVETCVCLLHEPTGTKVTCQDTRSKEKNRKLAWERMEKRLADIHRQSELNQRSVDRIGQVGHGGRLEKRRTYRVKENIVIDHVTDRRTDVSGWLRGKMDALHPNSEEGPVKT